MDVIDLWRYFGALLLVVGLIGFAAYGAKRFGLPGLVKPAGVRRLRIVETVIVSTRQRVCLIRRDNVEHLVLIGPEGSSVIESNIPAPPDQSADPALAARAQADAPTTADVQCQQLKAPLLQGAPLTALFAAITARTTQKIQQNIAMYLHKTPPKAPPPQDGGPTV
ncbi:MAG: flagellar biosynthetic protein FliO [Rhizomicrobium sp.]